MQLTQIQIKEFQKLHKEIFGVPISKQQALIDGLALIRLAALIQPIVEEELYGKS